MKRFLFMFLAVLILGGCASDTGSDSSDSGEFLVVALFEDSYVFDGFDVTVYVMEDGTYYESDLNFGVTGKEIDDATVTIGSLTVAFDDGWGYRLENQDWTPGDLITLTVTHDDFSVTGSIQVPTSPEVTYPGEDDYFASGVEVPITWNAINPEPDALEVRIPWYSMLDEDGTTLRESLSPSATGYTVPANLLDTSWPGAEVSINSIELTMLTGERIDDSSRIRFVNGTTLSISEN